MTEFELIKKYFQTSAQPGWLPVGVGDDGAVLAADPRQQVVVTDTLVEGVHFFAGTDAKAIGHKALAVNLSDLAAMGAVPRWATLNLTLPNADEAWLAQFAAGFYALANQYQVALIGGDTTAGPLTISVTAAGYLSEGQAPLLRSTAQAGDRVCVVGDLGLAGLAVKARQGQREPSPLEAKALDFPQPRLAEAQQIVGLATSAIDVSDGLLADLGHIANASELSAVLDGAVLAELSPRDDQIAATALLSGGDDYALLFSLPANTAVPEWASVIGQLQPKTGQLISLDGGPSWLKSAFNKAQQVPGFQHF